MLAHLWIGNGFSQETAFSTYDEKKAELLTVNDQLPEFLAGIRDAKVGSRLAVTASAEEAFGDDAATPSSASRTRTPSSSSSTWSSQGAGQARGRAVAGTRTGCRTPKFDEDGVIDRLRLHRAPRSPPTTCASVQLIKGTGPRVKKGQTIAVRYLGQAFDGDKPFDENFGDTGTGEPTTFSIGTGAVIKGWDQGLVGVPVGSRVVLEIPPELGYGAEGSPDSGIPKNADARAS